MCRWPAVLRLPSMRSACRRMFSCARIQSRLLPLVHYVVNRDISTLRHPSPSRFSGLRGSSHFDARCLRLLLRCDRLHRDSSRSCSTHCFPCLINSVINAAVISVREKRVLISETFHFISWRSGDALDAICLFT